ncbi:MAG TPA: hypothetical protein VK281_01705 [Xanthobacteraceae bacterium]|nr:hypothetical protein [Xanthobacteraceae bacterium]
MSVFVLAGIGIALGLAFAADRQAGNVATLCGGLNVGDGACDHAYLTKAGFDRVFADVESASSLTGRDSPTFAEKLRLAGTKLDPATNHQRATAARTRLADADAVRTLLDVDTDTTLHGTTLDEAAIFRLLLADPTGSPALQQMSNVPSDAVRTGG